MLCLAKPDLQMKNGQTRKPWAIVTNQVADIRGVGQKLANRGFRIVRTRSSNLLAKLCTVSVLGWLN